MASIINASTSGAGGVITTADASGELQLQSGGNAVVSFTNTGGTAPRITGDFSATTESNRVAFQSSTTNGNSSISVIPNGTSKFAGLKLYNSSDPDNASTFLINSNVAGTFINITSGLTGTGSFLPIQVSVGGSARAIFQTNGDFAFNSGYGSAATAYGCRAWVNFNGTANTNLTGTYSQTGTTVTVTITGHGYITGNSAFLDFTSGTAVDGAYTVTVTDANTFTVTQASRTTSGNVTSVRNTIRASGNVSSITDNGTGDYTINMTTAMPDANYSIAANAAASGTTDFQCPIKVVTNVSSFSIYTSNGTTLTDTPIVCVQVFR